jgi:uncharacterized protein (TIGR00255 family)
MILSMTGFGKNEIEVGGKTYQIELRTLNSKGVEFRTKIPDGLREKELELRKIVQEGVVKGKIDLNITTESTMGDGEYQLDENLLTTYCKQLSDLSKKLNLEGDILQAAMRVPSVLKPIESSLDDAEWEKLKKAVKDLIDVHRKYRLEEGKAMHEVLVKYTKSILQMVEEVKKMDTNRIESIRKRYESNFEKISRDVSADPNRLELEIIYYLEKLDFSEEIVRLVQHCEYMLEEIDNKELSKGRKLNFITQEMGREINTLGAKAYDSGIQKIVVEMKDDLEKIKEQTSNIL